MKAINQLKTFHRLLEEYPAETPLNFYLDFIAKINKWAQPTARLPAD